MVKPHSRIVARLLVSKTSTGYALRSGKYASLIRRMVTR